MGPRRAPDGLVRIFAVLAVSMPAFWLALILQLVFFQRLHVLPVAGQYDPNLDYTHPLTQYTQMLVVDALFTGNWTVLRSGLSHLVLPALVVALLPVRRDHADGPWHPSSRRWARTM